MIKPSLDRQFIGQAQLVRLLLWKIGDTTNVEECLECALQMGMIDNDDADFLRKCMQAEQDARLNGHKDLDRLLEADGKTIEALRRCADKLNRADSA